MDKINYIIMKLDNFKNNMEEIKTNLDYNNNTGEEINEKLDEVILRNIQEIIQFLMKAKNKPTTIRERVIINKRPKRGEGIPSSDHRSRKIYNTYSNEFKAKILKVVDHGRTINSIAKETGIAKSTIYTWKINKEAIYNSKNKRHTYKINNIPKYDSNEALY